MNLETNTHLPIRQLVGGWIKYFQEKMRANSHSPDDRPVVFAVTNRYPTRVALYAAAFQGGWRVRFIKSLREAVDSAHAQKPKAVFYDHTAGDPAWDQYCSALSHEDIPFVLLGHRGDDETFLIVLGAGGYHAWGDPLTSEEIVKAVEFAGECGALPHVPVT